MWNNTRLLNTIATGMFLLGAFIVVQIGVVSAASSPRFALSRAVVFGALEQVTRDQIDEALRGQPLGNFFSADLELVKQLVEDIPWVRRVDVRRQWPDRIEISIEEHKALARWGDRQLVSVLGEVFSAHTKAELPRLAGPLGTERDVTQRYYRVRELAKIVQTEPVEITLSARYAWHVRFANGLTVDLGREQSRASLESRLERFFVMQASTSESIGRRVTHADLRYPNGFAVRVPGLGLETQRGVNSKKAK